MSKAYNIYNIKFDVISCCLYLIKHMSNSTTAEIGQQQSQATITILSGIMIGFGYTLIGMIPWSMIFLITKRFGIKYYSLSDSDICMRIMKRLKDNTSEVGNDEKGTGYSIGYWYLVHISSKYRDEIEIWMIATDASYKNLTQEVDEEEPNIPVNDQVTTSTTDKPPVPTKSGKTIDIYNRFGSYSNLWYRKRPIKNFDYQPRPDQAILMKQIQELYATKKAVTIFLHGPPCTGKSIMGLLLADAYGSSYCNAFAPWEPGDTLGCLMDEVEPTKDKPLIIVWEEIDIQLALIHQGIEPHKNIPILVRNKSLWNTLLDKIQLGIYPNIILLLTSNMDVKRINQTLDESYLRKGRMDIIASLGCKED